MPNVFLSYSHENLDMVSCLARDVVAQEIDGHKISVWRDKTNLHAGQLWPKRLGEAIAASDFFLLAWSKSAAASHFVELEWNTAIALKKVLIPCLLDNTPLPDLLKAAHGIDAREPANAIPGVLNALKADRPPVDPGHRTAVIDKLSDIASTEPQEVVKAARAIFQQQEWTVQGNVYQAAGKIYIIGEASARPGREQVTAKVEKGLLEKWQTWVALVVSILTAITLAIELPKKWSPSEQSDPDRKAQSKEDVLAEQPLAGSIRDESGEPISGIKVALPTYGQTAMTDQFGHFQFSSVKAFKDESVALLSQKEGYQTDERYVTLGDTGLTFTMRRKRL